MVKKVSWQLMSVEELAAMVVANNGLYRKQKSYYKATNNVVMMGRLAEAEALLKLSQNCESLGTKSLVKP